jgi:hypothetical protein
MPYCRELTKNFQFFSSSNNYQLIVHCTLFDYFHISTNEIFFSQLFIFRAQSLQWTIYHIEVLFIPNFLHTASFVWKRLLFFSMSFHFSSFYVFIRKRIEKELSNKWETFPSQNCFSFRWVWYFLRERREKGRKSKVLAIIYQFQTVLLCF